jgi:hypothetical protein
VQVEVVDLVQRNQIDVAFNLFDRKEMPRDVEHRASILESRIVQNPSTEDGPRSRLFVIGHIAALDRSGRELA